MKPKHTILFLGLAGLLAAAGYGLWFSLAGGRTEGSARNVLFYQDSMHPWVKSDRPGKCTICSMDLTPIFEGEQGFGQGEAVVALSSNSITVLNVQTDEVTRQPLRHALRVAGTLEADETRTTLFSAPAAGRIEHLAVEYAGIDVKEGQALVTFYSPELVALRRQYVVRGRPTIALRQSELGQAHEDNSAQARPRNPSRTGGMMPVTETDPYYADLISPQTGTVTERNVFPGQYVAEGDRLFTIVDTSVLWLRFDVYERQLSWLRPGQKLRVTVPALPGREFSATLAWIEPTLDPRTRSAKVRADLENPLEPGTQQRLLRLGMYAEAQVFAEIPDLLTVPRSAVLLPGNRAYVYIEENPGAYSMRRVRLGRQGDEAWEVLEGLDEGERVVSAGNVLIDAQAQFTLGIDPAHDNAAETAAASPEMAGVDQHPGAAQVPVSSLAPTRREALKAFLTVADGISSALAADSLETLKSHTDKLAEAMSTALEQFAEDDSWRELLEKIEPHCAWPPYDDLAAARKSFLPFSTETVALVQQLRSQEPAFASLKVYHCPMAPKPGLWFQAAPPLRNPYYGAKMLTCGDEVRAPRPKLTPALVQPRPAPSLGAAGTPPSTAPARSVETVSSTFNRRNPEPMMSMAQALSYRLTEEKRAADRAKPAPASTAPTPRTISDQEQAEAKAVERMAAAVSSRGSADEPQPTAAAQGAGAASPPLTETQRKTFEGLVDAADAISQALAADDLKAFNSSLASLPNVIPALLREFAHPHPWNQYVRPLGGFSRWPAAENLEAARSRFLGFGSNTVAFAKIVRASQPQAAAFKIYYCPMAPKPGLWLQEKAPLRNPFFGAEMLTCGKEITP